METSPGPALVEHYERDGFVNAGTIFGPSEVDALRDELERYVDAAFRDTDSHLTLPKGAREITVVPGKSVKQFVNLWEVSPTFRRVVEDSRIAERAAELARSHTLQVWSDQVQYKAEHSGGAMTWHQDYLYWTPISPPIMLTAWIALDDADENNGCMWMVPGSHRWGGALDALIERQKITDVAGFRETPAWAPPGGSSGWVAPRPCPVRAGEVHFHHCMTWHGSPENLSSRARRAFAIHYMPGGVTFNGDQTHPLTAGSRLTKGGLMLDDPERFPVVWKNGAPFHHP